MQGVPTDLYPSRVGATEDSLRERIDPVIHGDAAFSSPHTLTARQLESFDRDGYLVLPGLMADRVELLRAEMARLSKEPELRGRPEVITEPDSDALRSIFAVHDVSSAFAATAWDPRIVAPARQILGDDVYIHQSRINVKPALLGRSFSWHSDFETWHVEDGIPRPRILTGWVFIDENFSYNGSLLVLRGSHRHYVSVAGTTPENNYRESLKTQRAGSPGQGALCKLAELAGNRIDTIVGPPGTVVFHEGNLMHCSPDNPSPWSRTNLFFVYNSVQNRPVAPFSGQAPRPRFLAAAPPDVEPPTT